MVSSTDPSAAKSKINKLGGGLVEVDPDTTLVKLTIHQPEKYGSDIIQGKINLIPVHQYVSYKTASRKRKRH